MEAAFELTPLVACKLIVYTFGALVHLFLMVLILGRRVFPAEKPDPLLLDIEIPEESGLEFLRELKPKRIPLQSS